MAAVAHEPGRVRATWQGYRVACSCDAWESMPYRTRELPLVAFDQHVEYEAERQRERNFLVAIMFLVVIFGGFTLGLYL